MTQKIQPVDYPNLFAEVVMASGAVRGQFETLQTNPEPKLISNVNLVPYTSPVSPNFLSLCVAWRN